VAETLTLLLVQDPATAARQAAAELESADVKVDHCSLRAAYARCKAQEVNAVLFFAKPTDVDTQFDPVLMRISRDCRRTLIYVVTSNSEQRLKLIADDHVQAVFSKLPPVGSLVEIVRRATEIRRAQRGRHTPRYPVRYGCMVKMLGTSGLVEGEVRQLGCGGFMVSLPDSPEKKAVNDPLRFTIFRKDSSGTTRIEGDGEVCWDDTSNISERGVRLGVKFTKLDAQSKGNLLSCINSLRTTITEHVSAPMP
jgi:hypothetical protein